MDDPAVETPRRCGGRWIWPAVVVLGLAVLAAVLLLPAWILAHRPPAQPVAAPSEIESVSLGYHFLTSGALPWLAQWAGLAVLLAVVAGGWFKVNWGAVVLGALFPLIAGLVWWVGLCAMFWTSDPLEGMFELLSWEISRQLGVEASWQALLFEVFGPLTCPLKLQGPASLEHWNFLSAGLSTALVMSTLTFVVRRTEADRADSERFNWKQFLLVLAWTLFYLAPVYIRALLRLGTSL